MSRIYVKNLPRLNLADLLRRRKMTLGQLLSEFGITTYEGLVARCDRMGVGAPSEKEFLIVAPVRVSSPGEGVCVVEALPEKEPELVSLVDVVVVTEPGQLESALAPVNVPDDAFELTQQVTEASSEPTKKMKKKKEGQSSEHNG